MMQSTNNRYIPMTDIERTQQMQFLNEMHDGVRKMLGSLQQETIKANNISTIDPYTQSINQLAASRRNAELDRIANELEYYQGRIKYITDQKNLIIQANIVSRGNNSISQTKVTSFSTAYLSAHQPRAAPTHKPLTISTSAAKNLTTPDTARSSSSSIVLVDKPRSTAPSVDFEVVSSASNAAPATALSPNGSKTSDDWESL